LLAFTLENQYLHHNFFSSKWLLRIEVLTVYYHSEVEPLWFWTPFTCRIILLNIYNSNDQEWAANPSCKWKPNLLKTINHANMWHLRTNSSRELELLQRFVKIHILTDTLPLPYGFSIRFHWLGDVMHQYYVKSRY